VAGLDPLVTINMYKLIERINREMGITVIMVSHDIQAATRYASHILHLGEDRQLFFGTREDYRHSAAYHSFMDGEKAVHIWKKAAVQEEKKRSGGTRAAAAAKTQKEAETESPAPEAVQKGGKA
jgi:ABC-type transporter Mla maintaining outer membrane lipid asymmetry ATPase subunit MlaF